MKYHNRYKKSLSDWLGCEPSAIQLYWKGRVGLYAILKAFGITDNDEVILPAFTCVVVPNAIIYCGAKPVYVDINNSTLNTSLHYIKEKITDKTKVIIVQNTFGLSNEVKEIVAYAKERNILTVEDCTHGFGGEYEGRPNGSYCDAAFYSTQWNKPFSTGIGGFAVMHNPSYSEDFKSVNKALETPSRKDRYVLGSLIQAKKYLLHDTTYWTALRLYRRLSKSGIVVGSSKGEELTGTKMPDNYFLRGVKVQEKVGYHQLKRLQGVLKTRKENGLKYNSYFRQNGFWSYSDEDLNNHSFLNYPVFVKDKALFQQTAEKEKIRLGDWFVSPIHPVLEQFELWEMNPKDFPNATKMSTHIVNLPTDSVNATKVIDFLEKNKNTIYTF